MFQNFVKAAWRNITRHKLHSLINISGLSIGLASCMLIIVYVNHELSYDRFHTKGDRIFDLNVTIKMGDNVVKIPYTSFAAAPIIQQSTSAVESYLRVYKPRKGVVIQNSDGSNNFENNLLFADPDFFEFFSFKLISGDVGRVLASPFSLVISKAAAKKYFGRLDPIGKTIKIKVDSGFYPFLITGIAENSPSNSTIQYDFLASNTGFRSMGEGAALLKSQVLEQGDFKTYLLLKQASDTGIIQHTIKRVLKEEAVGEGVSFPLINLRQIHLNSNSPYSINNKYFALFPIIAILILLLALVNFMSLSTARSVTRAKEIGVRKVAGASRINIIRQFYIESALYVIPSFIFAYGLCYLSLPLFLSKLAIKIDPSFLFSGREVASLFSLLVITILLAGSYPSLILSAFQPIVVLKGKMNKKAAGSYVFNFFTVLQFTISIALIISGIVIRQQLYYLRHTDTGVARDNILMVSLSNTFGNQYRSFKQDVKALTGISKVATARYPIYNGYYDIFSGQGKDKHENIFMAMFSIDTSFIPLLGIQWKVPPLPGIRMTSGDRVIINEAAAKKLDLPSNPVGTVIYNGNEKAVISGVVRDFTFGSMEYSIKPLCMTFYFDTSATWGETGGCLYAKIDKNTPLRTLLNRISNIFKKYDSENPFKYSFMDEVFDQQYKSEDRLQWLLDVCSGITIFLALIGLYGLSAFMIEQRAKEIGIRKVLGAGIMNITVLLSKGFLGLVLLSAVIASAIAGLTMNKWLEGFSYRIGVHWWIFPGTGLSVLLIVAATLSYRSIRLATDNPITNLRTE